MSKEKRRVPKLRFPGFAEDWEQRKFGDLFEYERPDAYIVKSDNYNDDFNMPVLTANKAFILGYTNEENSYNKPSIIFDDFTLDRKYVDFPYMLKSSTIKILTSKNQHNLRFLFERLNSTRFELLGHARHYISVVQNTITFCPSVEEEVCISNLLTKFDELITLHQRKLNNLKLKKKALLQKLFPKNGERYPELRFPGFTDAWEQRKLGDIATFSKGNGYSKSDLTPSGDPIILYGRLYTNYETTISNVDTFVELKDKSVISQGGEVIVPASGETAEDISRASVVKNQGIIIGGDLNVIKVNHLLDPTFLALTISNGEQQKELSKRAQGKSVVHLHNSDLQEVNLTFPLLNEQKEISTLFEKMDNIITLHQRKLGHLQLQKKALLQQMFV